MGREGDTHATSQTMFRKHSWEGLRAAAVRSLLSEQNSTSWRGSPFEGMTSGSDRFGWGSPEGSALERSHWLVSEAEGEDGGKVKTHALTSLQTLVASNPTLLLTTVFVYSFWSWKPLKWSSAGSAWMRLTLLCLTSVEIQNKTIRKEHMENWEKKRKVLVLESSRPLGNSALALVSSTSWLKGRDVPLLSVSNSLRWVEEATSILAETGSPTQAHHDRDDKQLQEV